MNVVGLKLHNVGDFDGISASIYCSGCCHNCKGCHNKVTQNCNHGEPLNETHMLQLHQCLDNDYVENLVLCGGEPFMHYNISDMMYIVRDVLHHHPTKRIVAFSGFTYEQIISNPQQKQLLELCDVLIDGKFVLELYSPALRFRGSSNQRIISVKDSLASNKVIELTQYY